MDRDKSSSLSPRDASADDSSVNAGVQALAAFSPQQRLRLNLSVRSRFCKQTLRPACESVCSANQVLGEQSGLEFCIAKCEGVLAVRIQLTGGS